MNDQAAQHLDLFRSGSGVPLKWDMLRQVFDCLAAIPLFLCLSHSFYAYGGLAPRHIIYAALSPELDRGWRVRGRAPCTPYLSPRRGEAARAPFEKGRGHGAP